MAAEKVRLFIIIMICLPSLVWGLANLSGAGTAAAHRMSTCEVALPLVAY